MVDLQTLDLHVALSQEVDYLLCMRCASGYAYEAGNLFHQVRKCVEHIRQSDERDTSTCSFDE